MCDHELTRRDVLFGTGIAAAGYALGSAEAKAFAMGSGPTPEAPAVEVMPGLRIYPRAAWGADLPPKGPILRETPKFLLIHHTDTSNFYTSARDLIRSGYRHQTVAPRFWPDVCYEFFVGRDGDVWEGRAGALAGPVVADATNGSQGFAQLVCLLGRYATELPTPAAMDSLVKVLAWLADRYDIDTWDGARATFVSRGSDHYPRGATVNTRTIAGHREMSATECPGDAFFPRINLLYAQVEAQRAAWRTVLKPAMRLDLPR